MAEITRRRVGELQRGVFKVLLEHPDGLPAKEVLRRLEQVVPPTEFEKSNYPKRPDVRRFEKIARFATIGPVKAGWLVKSKGRWYLTEEGIKAYNHIQDPEKFTRETRRLYLQWRASQPEAIDELEEGVSDAASSIEKAATANAVEEAEETAWGEIEQYLQAINPYDLQKLVAALLRAMGYHISSVSYTHLTLPTICSV